MHHPGHSGGGCPKCVINMKQIAVLATLLGIIANSEAARQLAAVASAAAGMHDALGIKAARSGDKPCAHAVQLVAWICEPRLLDSAAMTTMMAWVDEILNDIEELVGVDVDPHQGEGG